MSKKLAKEVDLKEKEPLLPISDWLEDVAMEDEVEKLDYVENMTIPEELLAAFPAALQKMHKAFFNLVVTAIHIDAYYARPLDPKVEKANHEQYLGRKSLASMFLRFLLCPRGMLLTLEHEGKPFLVSYGRLGPFCKAADAEQAFDVLWSEKLKGWEETEFVKENVEEKCAQYLMLLSQFDPEEPYHKRNEVFKMPTYREKWTKIHEMLHRFSASEVKASQNLSAEERKGEKADPQRIVELNDYITDTVTDVKNNINELGLVDKKMRIQHQIEKFITARNKNEPCPRLKFEYPAEPEDEEDGNATPRPGEAKDTDIMTDMAGLNDALSAAMTASKDEWEVQEIGTARAMKMSKPRRLAPAPLRSNPTEDKGKGRIRKRTEGDTVMGGYDGDAEE